MRTINQCTVNITKTHCKKKKKETNKKTITLHQFVQSIWTENLKKKKTFWKQVELKKLTAIYILSELSFQHAGNWVQMLNIPELTYWM